MASHASLTGAQLHEPKGVAAATIGEVYIADGAGSGAWDILTHTSAPSGSVIGHSITTLSTASTISSTYFPVDDTIPQNTEGSEVFTISYTPKRADSIIVVEALVHLTTSNNAVPPGIAFFKDSSASAVAASVKTNSYDSGQTPSETHLIYTETAGSTTARTYKIRASAVYSSNITIYVNRATGGRIFGGVVSSILRVTEYKA